MTSRINEIRARLQTATEKSSYDFHAHAKEDMDYLLVTIEELQSVIKKLKKK